MTKSDSRTRNASLVFLRVASVSGALMLGAAAMCMGGVPLLLLGTLGLASAAGATGFIACTVLDAMEAPKGQRLAAPLRTAKLFGEITAGLCGELRDKILRPFKKTPYPQVQIMTANAPAPQQPVPRPVKVLPFPLRAASGTVAAAFNYLQSPAAKDDPERAHIEAALQFFQGTTAKTAPGRGKLLQFPRRI